jgi:glycosyltransferase involved in cell wall biosynthesis
MTVEISIIICTFNRYDVLTEAIAAIEQQDLDASRFELIVVDNSNDKNAQSQYREGLDIVCQHRYLIEDTPGLSRARNLGVRAASAPIVAFMDDDARPSTNWAASIIAAFAEFSDVAIVGGPVRPIWPTGRPSWLHEWLEGFLTIVDRGPVTRELRPGEWLAGTNIAFRKEILERVGLFEENLGRIGSLLLSNEELKISDRISALGFKTLYVPNIGMRHHVHADRITQAWMRRRVFWQTVSDLFVTGGGTESTFSEDAETLLSFLAELPRRHRGPSGLFVDLDEPVMFHKQTQALSAMIRLVATDGHALERFVQDGTR